MNNKIYYIFIIVSFLFSCMNTDVKKNLTIDDSISDVDETILSEKWIIDNTPIKDSNLISFSFHPGTKSDYTKYEKILLLPYEKNKIKDTHSKIETFETKDSTIISYWKFMVIEGCNIYGNIKIQNDTLVVLTEKKCSPFQEITDGEILLMNFKYVIDSKANKKKIIINNL